MNVLHVRRLWGQQITHPIYFKFLDLIRLLFSKESFHIFLLWNLRIFLNPYIKSFSSKGNRYSLKSTYTTNFKPYSVQTVGICKGCPSCARLGSAELFCGTRALQRLRWSGSGWGGQLRYTGHHASLTWRSPSSGGPSCPAPDNSIKRQGRTYNQTYMYMNKPILFHNKSLLLCASLIKNISYTEIHFTNKKKPTQNNQQKISEK